MLIIAFWGIIVEADKAGDMLTAYNFVEARTYLLTMVDTAIIMLLAVDLLRTVVISIREGKLSVRSIVEVALIVIVREMVASTIEEQTVNPISILCFSGAFAIIAVAYVASVKFGGAG